MKTATEYRAELVRDLRDAQRRGAHWAWSARWHRENAAKNREHPWRGRHGHGRIRGHYGIAESDQHMAEAWYAEARAMYAELYLT